MCQTAQIKKLAEPDWIHLLDSGVAKKFYLNDDGSIAYEESYWRKNQPHLTLLALKDDFTGVIYAQFYINNDTKAWLDFLNRAWQLKNDPVGFPFHGAPEKICLDNDTMVHVRRFILSMNQLNVEITRNDMTFPVNSKISDDILNEFVKVSKNINFKSIEAANEAMIDYLYFANSRPDKNTGVTPFQRWCQEHSDWNTESTL